MLAHKDLLRVLYSIWKYLKVFLFLLFVPIVGIVFIILNLLKIIAPRCMFKFATTNILNQIHLNDWKNSSNITKMSDLKFLFSFDMYKVSLKMVFKQVLIIYSFQWFVVKGLEDRLKSSTLGSPAPDVKVLDILSKKTVGLLSRAKNGRPLVLNFGSSS